MAKLEMRLFGSKKHLLVLPSKRELARVKKALGLKEHAKFDGTVKMDDYWQPYLVLEKR